MLTWIAKISVFCFAASYACAFALEAWHLYRPRPILRIVSLGLGAAGLFAHAVYLIHAVYFAVPSLPIGSPTGSLFFLAMILAVFYFYGAMHHRRVTWGLFVLPVVLGLIGLGAALNESTGPPVSSAGWNYFWGVAHGTLLIFSAVGVCVGFIASVMYLVQLRRLQAKLPPGQAMLSLERLEEMNRNAILASFPLLTAGLLAGLALQVQYSLDWQTLLSVRVLSVLGLWIVFAILLYLRYRVHVRGRQLALWTMFAFAILVLALVSPHSFVQGGLP